MQMLWSQCKFPRVWMYVIVFELVSPPPLLCCCRRRPPRWRGPPPLLKPPLRRERPSSTSPMWVLSVQLLYGSIWCIERPVWAWGIAICKNIQILYHRLPCKVVTFLQGWAYCDSRRPEPLGPATRYSNNPQFPRICLIISTCSNYSSSAWTEYCYILACSLLH